MASSAQALASNEPVRVGRYLLLSEVGKGGMGIVYRAHDPKIEREVALKTILSTGGGNQAELRRRLEREARAAGGLNHPNIVTVYDVGEWNDSFYIAMEYVSGTPLDRVIKEGKKLEIGEILSIITQVAGALDYAHSKGIVHRDIKPANLLLPEDGRVKVTDFGIARLSRDSITQEGGRVGSPSYMSPEQILAEEVDGRTDFFSLGVVFYQLLTGRKPFRGKNVPAITHAICHDTPEPPSRSNPSLPRRFDQIVLKLLSKEREQRYAKGAELAADLAPFQSSDLTKVAVDYSAPAPKEDARERTPPPAAPPRINAVFKNIETNVRTFSVGERTGRTRPRFPRQALYGIAAAGALLLAGAAVFFLR
ncbi:MAG: serine/threonine-protein kinase [Bdellovibrionota bacterium]